jgi:hypothetical protein
VKRNRQEQALMLRARAAELYEQSRAFSERARSLMAEARLLEEGPGEILRGRMLVAVAARELRKGGHVGSDVRGLHYKELAAAIEGSTGARIGGQNPHATLLAGLSRDPRFAATEPGAGRYRLNI